jgi:hypothetical protein
MVLLCAVVSAYAGNDVTIRARKYTVRLDQMVMEPDRSEV